MPRPQRFIANTLVLFSLVVGALALSGAGAGTARADSKEDIAKVTDLNKKALAAYDDLELDDAKKFLMQALQICASAGLDKHPIKARTLVHLGVILFGGSQDKEGALRQFQKALEIMPGVTLTASLVNPEIKALFDQAKAGVGAPEPDKTVEKPVEDAEKTPSDKETTEKPDDKVKPDEKAAEGADKEAVAKEPVEEAPPADVTGILHEPVPTAAEGQKIEIKAAVEKAMNAARVVLAYKPEGGIDFLARDMEEDDLGWYTARIPEPATRGKLVHYYIEARNKAGKAIANNGSLREPHVVAIGAGGAAEVADESLVAGDDHEDPLKHSDRDGGEHPTLMVALGLGSGYGRVSGTPEVSPTEPNGDPINQSAMAPSGSIVISPEIGYYVNAHLILSLQGRVQILTGLTTASDVTQDSDGNDVTTTYTPAPFAAAVFGKATYLMGAGRVRPFVFGAAGAGYVRHVVNIGVYRNDCGPGRDLDCIDTIKGGPVLIGAGAGVRVGLTDSLTLVGAVNPMLGLPNSTFNIDFNVGLALGL